MRFKLSTRKHGKPHMTNDKVLESECNTHESLQFFLRVHRPDVATKPLVQEEADGECDRRKDDPAHRS